jgi:hypothetical protein
MMTITQAAELLETFKSRDEDSARANFDDVSKAYLIVLGSLSKSSLFHQPAGAGNTPSMRRVATRYQSMR